MPFSYTKPTARCREVPSVHTVFKENVKCCQIAGEGLEGSGLNFFVLGLVCYLTDDSLIFLVVYFRDESERFQHSSAAARFCLSEEADHSHFS